MTRTKPSLKRSFWIILFIAVFSNGYAQKRLSFSGNLELGNYKGIANYKYQVIGIDTIYDGPFTFERSDLNALLKKADSTFAIKGNFEEGRPDGNWLFQFGEFFSDSTTQVSGFQYRVNVNGKLQETLGSFDQGKPNGEWRFSQKIIKDSQVLDTLFFSELTFLDGVPQQNFTIENDKGTLVGRLLRNGLAHDTWSLYSNKGDNPENWSFQEGWLKSVERLMDGVPVTIEVFNDETIHSSSIDLDQGYSTLISIYAQFSSDQEFDFTKGINKLLVKNDSNYKKIDRILSDLGAINALSGVRVKAPYFPLNDLSRKQLDSTIALIKRASEISNTFLTSTQLNLMKRSDDESNTLYHTIAALDQTFLKPLGRLMKLQELGIVENINEEMLSKYLFPNGRPSPQLTITDDDGHQQTFLGPVANRYNFSDTKMKGYLDMAEYVFKSMNEIAAALGQKFADDTQKQELVLLEEQMIAQANVLNQIPDSVSQSSGNNELKALNNIKYTTEQLLLEYAEMPADNNKLNRARLLIKCLLQFDALSKEITKLPQKNEELEKKYTDAVWNPFTATIMDESVKKRIVSAYSNVLIPNILEQAQKELNCKNADYLQQMLKNIHQRMLELREEDTSKLERKLRKERNPNVILQLFNLTKSMEE